MDNENHRAKPLLASKLFEWPQTIEYLEFEKIPVAKPRALIKNLLDCGSRILFAGGSKTFKTWLQCDLAVSIASGAPWLGFETHQSNVIYVNLELKEYYLQRRLSEIRKAREISLKPQTLFVWNLRGVSFNRENFATELLKRCQLFKIGIAFIDPFYKLLNHLEDENNQTHMGAVLRSFDEVNKNDVTSAFGIHFSKGNQATKDPEDRISGAGTIVRDADDVITLTKHEEPLAFTIDFIIRDHPPIDSFVVKWQTPIMTRTDLDPSKIKSLRGRRVSCDPADLLAIITDNDDQLLTKDLEAKVSDELGWAKRTFYQKLGDLLKQKAIFKSKLTDKWNAKVHN